MKTLTIVSLKSSNAAVSWQCRLSHWQVWFGSGSTDTSRIVPLADFSSVSKEENQDLVYSGSLFIILIYLKKQSKKPFFKYIN